MLLELRAPNALPPVYREAVCLAENGAEVTWTCWGAGPVFPGGKELAERLTLRWMFFRSDRLIEEHNALTIPGTLQAAGQYPITFTGCIFRGQARAWPAGAVNTLSREKEGWVRTRANCLREALARYNREHEHRAIRSAYPALVAGYIHDAGVGRG